jgi:hypothetical protein
VVKKQYGGKGYRKNANTHIQQKNHPTVKIGCLLQQRHIFAKIIIC